MKKLIHFLLFFTLLVAGKVSYADDFTAVSPSGHTLSYEIIDTNNRTVAVLGLPAQIGNVIIPPSVIVGDNTYTVTTIIRGSTYISPNSSLTSVVIPNTVTSIGNSAFSGCQGLTSITIPNSVTSIGEGAFLSCRGLTSITIPNSVITMGERAFANCYSLTTVTISRSVTSIGRSSFERCTSLRTIRWDDSPDRLTSIGSDAFWGCTSLTSITIPGSVTIIEKRAFYDCSSLISIIIPDSITTINDYTFYNCTSLVSVTIPRSVVTIGRSAFEGCSSITSIILPNSVKTIGQSAFEGCSSITSIMLPNSVTSIGDGAFSNCWSLSSVNIPDSVTTINNYVFNCCSLNSITIPNSVTSIGDYAFRGCRFTSLTIPDGVTHIGYRAFFNCRFLESVSIPNSVTSMGKAVFAKCSMLDSVTIPPNVNIIEDSSFAECSALKTIVLPSNITNIDTNAFASCTSLCKITLPSNLTWIGYGAFCNCRLTTITIPCNVRYIGCIAFQACLLKSVIFEGVNPPLPIGNTGYTPFLLVDSAYVPYGSLQSYQLWYSHKNQFYNIVEYVTLSLTASPSNMGNVYRSGRFEVNKYRGINAIPFDGYRFVRWSDGVTWASRSILLTSDTTMVAYFEQIPTYTVSLTANADSMGIVSGTGTYNDNTYATISATPNNGYRFVRWSDGNTANTRSIRVMSDTTLVAYFEQIPTYMVSLTVNPTSAGLVYGARSYQENTYASLSATPYSGYRFVRWSDGVTSESRIIYVISDISIVAEFELIPRYTVSLTSSPSEGGLLSGAGTYNENTDVTISATPNIGYRFVRWSDGSIENTRLIIISSDTSFVAYFEEVNHTVSLTAYPSNAGSVSGAGTYAANTTASIEAIPNNGYRFTQWSDGNTDNPRSITVNNDISLVAYFEQIGTSTDVYYTITLTASPSYMGSVLGGGTYRAGEDVTISATPASQEYYFSRWSDGNTSNPRTIYNLSSDLSLTAYFNSPSGIENISDAHFTAFAQGRHIIVIGAKNMPVVFYDMQGRQLETKQSRNDQPLRFDAPATGIYMIKVGNLPAQRVAILR